MKVLNLYAGIGGNRMLWGNEHEITAVENVPEVAAIYKHLFPNDNVVIDDAHEYLRKHFREFDFIWASPPCPTHSVLQMTRYYDKNLKYPDMTLYQEIIWLQTFFKGKWCIENVKPYYKPLITPTFTMERHCYWASDFIMTQPDNDNAYTDIRDDVSAMEKEYGLDLSQFKGTTDMGTKTVLKVPNQIGDKYHPTEKPVGLMEILIANSTNENDIVLEPFAGSGATCIAARNLKRRFIGIEIDETYCATANKRLEMAQQQTLF